MLPATEQLFLFCPDKLQCGQCIYIINVNIPLLKSCQNTTYTMIDIKQEI